MESRLALLQGRVHLAGALSGRDINAANKTMSGLLKLPSPSAEELEIPAEYLEWAVRLGLEVRRRAKEPQKRIGHARRSLHAKAT